MKIRMLLRSRTFRLWLACYLIVLLLPLVFSTIEHSRTNKSLTQKAYAHGQSAVNQIAGTVDEQFRTIYNISDAICASAEIRKLRYVTLPFDAADYYEVHQRARSLTDYSAHSSLISGLYVYCRNLDAILDSGHIFTRNNQYLSVMNKQFRIDEALFDRLMAQRHLHDLYLVDGGRRLLMLQTVFTGISVKEPPLTLIVVINAEEMTKAMTHVSLSWDGEARALLPEQSLLFRSDGYSASVFGSISELTGESEEQIISVAQSEVSPFYFVLSIPEHVFFSDVNSSSSFFRYFFVCTLLLSLMIAYLLARYNYLPVHKLKENADVVSSGRNEFSLISNRIQELKTDRDQMKQEIARLELIEDKHLFSALLDGNLNDLDEQAIESLRGSLDGNLFVCSIFETDREEVSADARKELATSLQEVTANTCANTCQCFIHVNGNDVIGLFSFHGKTDPYDAQLYTKKLISKIISEGQLQTFSAYIGNAHENPAGISVSFREADRTREYARFVAENEKQVMVYDHTMYSSHVSFEDYDVMDEERQFVSLLLKGNYDACEQLVYNIITYYSGHEGVSLYVLRYRMYSIMSLMMKVLREIEPNADAALYENSDLVQRLTTARTMQELEDAIFRILDQLRKDHDAEPDQRTQKLDRAEQYIMANYQDPMLSVQQVAENFNLSLPYLSREFKNSRGMGVLSYINLYRISKAKELLLDGSMTIADIARDVGYNSSQTLIRIFKRYENITPGQFRAAQSGKND